MMRKRVSPRRCFLKLFAIVALTAIPIGLALPGNPGARADAAGPAADPPDQNVSNTRLILLGTAGGPIKVRSQPSSLLIVDGVLYMIDAGIGTIRQLARADYSPRDLKALFITHNHLDHNGDLGNVISVGWMDGRTDPLLIYGPYGTEHMVAAALDYFSVPERIYMEQAIFYVPASSSVQPHDITKGGLVYSDGRVKVFAAENTHYQTFNAGRDKSFSYRFETPGRVIVFSGDTGPSEALTELARGADILVSEVIDTEDAVRMIASDPHFPPQAQKPLAAHIRHNHLSPEEVGNMATKAGDRKSTRLNSSHLMRISDAVF